MQKIQLHIFLLVLLAMGCSSRTVPPSPPYFDVKNKLILDFESDEMATLLLQGVRVNIEGESDPFYRIENPRVSDQAWQVWWEREEGPIEMEPRQVLRTLTSLEMTDSLTGAHQMVSPLAGGGIIFRMEGRSSDAIGLAVTASRSEGLLTSSPRRVGEQIWMFMRGDSLFMAVAVSGKDAEVRLVSALGADPSWRISLAPAKNRQVVLAFGKNEKSARETAEEYVKLRPGRVRQRVLANLKEQVAFSLVTQDDRSNSAYALLAAALANAESRPDLSTRTAIEEYSQRSAAEFLASRALPQTVFPSNPDVVPPSQKQAFLRWGSASFGVALVYGMASDDSLKQVSLDVLSGISKLQADYTTADLEALSDFAISDSLMRLAVAHIRMAGIMSLGADIALARGDREAQGIFRGEAIRAGRRADKFIKQSEQSYRMHKSDSTQLQSFFDEDSTSPSGNNSLLLGSSSTPDTVLLLAAGAKYGLNWLGDDPATLWNPELPINKFVWQKWVDYRFRGNLKITETPDYDSLLTMLLNGPVPGLLVENNDPLHSPALSGMAAAFQNLAELYVGIQPDVSRHRVDIEPRIPAVWGNTTASVPYGPGRIEVNYHFADEYATVGMSDVGTNVDVYFGYPLRSGSFLRAQFTLSPGDHPQRIDLKHEAEGRIRLEVNEVP